MSRARRRRAIDHVRKYRYRYLTGIIALITIGTTAYLGTDSAHVPFTPPSGDPIVLTRLPAVGDWCTTVRSADHCYTLQETSGDATDLGASAEKWALVPESGITQGVEVAPSTGELAIDPAGLVSDLMRRSTDATSMPDATNLVSVSSVVFSEAITGTDDIYSHRTTGTGAEGIEVRFHSDGHFDFLAKDGVLTKVSASTGGFSDGAWHCATVVGDGTSASAARWYVDGVDVTSSSDISGMATWAASGRPALGGFNVTPTIQNLAGKLARLRIDYASLTLANHKTICGVP